MFRPDDKALTYDLRARALFQMRLLRGETPLPVRASESDNVIASEISAKEDGPSVVSTEPVVVSSADQRVRWLVKAVANLGAITVSAPAIKVTLNERDGSEIKVELDEDDTSRPLSDSYKERRKEVADLTCKVWRTYFETNPTEFRADDFKTKRKFLEGIEPSFRTVWKSGSDGSSTRFWRLRSDVPSLNLRDMVDQAVKTTNTGSKPDQISALSPASGVHSWYLTGLFDSDDVLVKLRRVQIAFLLRNVFREGLTKFFVTENRDEHGQPRLSLMAIVQEASQFKDSPIANWEVSPAEVFSALQWIRMKTGAATDFSVAKHLRDVLEIELAAMMPPTELAGLGSLFDLQGEAENRKEEVQKVLTDELTRLDTDIWFSITNEEKTAQ